MCISVGTRAMAGWCRGSTPPAAKRGCSAFQRGNGYLRRLLLHAARALQRRAKTQDDRLGARLRGLETRAHPNVAAVARAAKLARWSWAVLTKNQALRPAAAEVGGSPTNCCAAVDGMATTLERRRWRLTNQPTLGVAWGDHAGAVRISMTAMGPWESVPRRPGREAGRGSAGQRRSRPMRRTGPRRGGRTTVTRQC
jgi:hypothetical protein